MSHGPGKPTRPHQTDAETAEYWRGIANGLFNERDEARAALRAATASESRLRGALDAAARSLAWIGNRKASSDEQRTTLDVLSEVRAYALSRAGVARAALLPEGTP